MRQSILRAEAEMLLQWAADWTRSELLSRLSDPVEPDILRAFQKGVRDRVNGIPLQYITGSAGFYGREFTVKEGCLIPRPETEWLVETAKEWIHEHHQKAVVMDVGTGSGAIAVTLKLECPYIQMHAVDVSTDALQMARRNAEVLHAPVFFHHGDGITLLRERCVPVNVLVSNPPYIPSNDVNNLEDEVKNFEPHAALDGGQDGLDFYRSFIETGDHMFASGPAALFMEVGAGQAQGVSDWFTESDKWKGWKFWTVPDLRGIERVVAGFR